MEKPIDSLIKTIKNLSGNKIVTIANFEKQEARQYDVLSDGSIGYDFAHAAMFAAKLVSAMHVGGSAVIRQFTDISKDGTPVQKIYGISLCNEDWFPITADEMEKAHCTDHESGRKIPKEKNVVFGTITK